MRYLQDASVGKDGGTSVPYPDMSLPYPGMSLPFPGMSFPNPAMSLPNPGMSLPNPGMSLPQSGMFLPMKTQEAKSEPSASPSFAPTRILPVATRPPSPPSSALHNTNDCTPQDTTAHAHIDLRLDVDSFSSGSIFLESLASLTGDIVSNGEIFFSLCKQPGNRMLPEYQTNLGETEIESAVTGLEASASPAGDVGGKLTGRNTLCCLTVTVKIYANNYFISLTHIRFSSLPTFLQTHARQRRMELTARLLYWC